MFLSLLAIGQFITDKYLFLKPSDTTGFIVQRDKFISLIVTEYIDKTMVCTTEESGSESWEKQEILSLYQLSAAIQWVLESLSLCPLLLLRMSPHGIKHKNITFIFPQMLTTLTILP
jgi:hypothetical protein